MEYIVDVFDFAQVQGIPNVRMEQGAFDTTRWMQRLDPRLLIKNGQTSN